MARTRTTSKKKAAPKRGATTRTKAKAAPKKRVKALPQAGAFGPDNRRSIFFLGGIATCVFTLLSLASYSATDPAFSRRSSVEEVANWCGRWGALLADLLYQTLGLTAWAVGVVAVWFGLRLARREGATVGRLFAGIGGTWWAATLLALLFYPDAGGDFPRGGLLGDVTAGMLLGTVGTVGSYVIVLVLLLVAATVVFGINWETLAGRGVDAVEGGTPRIWNVFTAGTRGAWARSAGLLSGARERLAEAREAREARLEASLDQDADQGDEVFDSGPESIAAPSVGSGLDIAIDHPEPVVALESGITGVRFDADAPSVGDAVPTAVAQRALVEVEYVPTVNEYADPTPATPVQDHEPPKSEGYDLPLADSSPSFEPSAAPYLGEDVMGDGSVYDEPSGRPSQFDVVEPMFVRPSVSDPHLDHEPASATPAPKRATPEPAIEPGDLVSGGHANADLIARPSEPEIVWELPPYSLLDQHDRSVGVLDEDALKDMAEALVQKLADFNVRGEVTAIRPGPVITIFEYLPAAGIKVSKIASLSDDIAMAMRALRVRIVAPIPGKGVVGIEIPNKNRQTVWYRDIVVSKEFRAADRQLPLAIGKTTDGRPYVTDLVKMPHLLVGGTTGSGKSVGVNAMLVSMLYARTPDELRLILVDPKMLEFELYNDIPHLLHPVVTEPKLAAAALKWACDEMDRRYRLLARWSVRSITSYNKKVDRELEDWTPVKARRYAPRKHPSDQPLPRPAKLPYIVIVIDELADLMMVASKDVEEAIVRLAQKARACGVHLVVATQRPSVDVITGLIKANMPTRIAFQVRSKTDGRTILDQNGAETLLGKGDMLVLPPGVSALLRCHGPFVADDEVTRVCEFWRDQGEPSYDAEIRVVEDHGLDPLSDDDYDENYDIAVQIVTEAGKASTSMIQRRLKIGYNRAARIVEVMEREGIVGPADGARPRKVLVPPIEG
ncbi:MAG TPA: DNA translocase FtsK 4TM domain-containing protein [Myxococcota bacterium]|nr:DNA translocase FtsK 4TM domain-containing protein [Myxococcota bacterium]